MRRPRQRQQRARRDPASRNVSRADDIFGEDESQEQQYADEYPEEEDEQAPAVGITDMYEPAVIQEFFLSDKDVEVRKTDLPERLQLEMEGREIVSTLEDVRAEARWMVNVSKEVQWLNSSHMEDSGDDMVEVLNPKAGGGDDKEFLQMTRSARAKFLRDSLIEKVSLVLCYLRSLTRCVLLLDRILFLGEQRALLPARHRQRGNPPRRQLHRAAGQPARGRP